MKRSFANAGKKYLFGDFTIFLDMDGVIADFDTHLDTHNKRDESGKTKWEELDYEWFASIPVFEGAQAFYNTLRMLAPVKFLTAPTMSTRSIAGKSDWLQNDFAPKQGKLVLKDLIIMPSSDKHYIAGPKRILIDDRQNNIHEWVDAGGIGVLHKGDFEKTYKKVCEAVEPKRGMPFYLGKRPRFFLDCW